ncbi:MAG: alanine--tRNA ligase-related protein, partial [Sodalinema sp.]
MSYQIDVLAPKTLLNSSSSLTPSSPISLSQRREIDGSTQSIRDRFIHYYQDQGFQTLPRAPMSHPSIPMSFVMSAGLVQVELSLSRFPDYQGQQFVLVQDCFRHFDLDSIGRDESHLSLFEMPGAFVFGPNAKAATIRRMWTLATQQLGINPEQLWVSYFAGGDLEGNALPADEETYEAWRELGLAPERLVGLGVEDNYWQQSRGLGFTGDHPRKCGPNTELFYDLGARPDCDATCGPQCRCGRFLEFSNSLFIDSELEEDHHEIIPLDNPFTETVIGTERVAVILQGVSSVFETADYRPLIGVIRQYRQAQGLPEGMAEESERIIADHLKALWVLVGDGAPPPGKNGRERIVKLLIRRAIARLMVLEIEETAFFPVFLSSLVQQWQKRQGSREGQTALRESRVETLLKYIEAESVRFHKTVERGHDKLRQFIANWGEGLDDETSLEANLIDIEKNWG